MPIEVFPLILKAYNLKDEGDISRVDAMPLTHVNNVNNRVMVRPAEIFDLKTFNQKLLKPECKILFDFVQKVFMAFAGIHKSATLPKFKVLTAVMQNFSVNWERVLLNLLYDESKMITPVNDRNKVMDVNFGRPLHHGCKVNFMMHDLMTGRNWSEKVHLPEDKLLPNSYTQLEM